MDGRRQVLVVCAANVCRSPMGEALLRDRVTRADLPIDVSSAGVDADRHQLPVDPMAVRALSSHRLDVSGHEPRAVTRSLIDRSDLVITMTRDDLRRVAVAVPRAFSHTFTWKELVRRSLGVASGLTWVDWLLAVGEGRSARDLMGDDSDDDVADPYGGTFDDRVRCADELARLADRMTGVWASLAW